GSVEAALWNFLGPRPVTAHVIDVFSALWARDVIDELNMPCHSVTADQKNFLSLEDPTTHDLLITHNGTTSGLMYPNFDWIKRDREGLVVADLTSSAFCVPVPWEKIDVGCFSWQKGLGSEAAHGMMVLSPKAVHRLMTHTPSWPIPRLFRLMTSDGKKGEERVLNKGLFEGLTLNTPSMLCVEDCVNALDWAFNIGGGHALYARCATNFKAVHDAVTATPLLSFTAADMSFTSTVSPCIQVNAITSMDQKFQWEWLREIAQKLEQKNVGLDILNHAYGTPSFRLWCGPTVDAIDIKNFMNSLIVEVETACGTI
ncbi:MAG: phosphoserine aminotransferase, partial [Alphaproteobacteria bacterium]|nr:phosphoserine aminotransferase [Alphaproteobacteria bacterium]